MWDGDESELESCYVIHAPEVGRVKIGSTKGDPIKRLRVFQGGSPVVLGLVAVLEGGWRKEQELHRQFAEYRLHGEWFDDSILAILLKDDGDDDNRFPQIAQISSQGRLTQAGPCRNVPLARSKGRK